MRAPPSWFDSATLVGSVRPAGMTAVGAHPSASDARQMAPADKSVHTTNESSGAMASPDGSPSVAVKSTRVERPEPSNMDAVSMRDSAGSVHSTRNPSDDAAMAYAVEEPVSASVTVSPVPEMGARRTAPCSDHSTCSGTPTP